MYKLPPIPSTCLLMFLAAISLCQCRLAAAGSDPNETTLSAYQRQLLDIAASAANAIPIEPHIKDRSRSQQMVVETSLKLGQPERALQVIGAIENWRGNLCYTKLASYYASEGRHQQARQMLVLAARVPQEKQEWRIERIEAEIAKVQAAIDKADTPVAKEPDSGNPHQDPNDIADSGHDESDYEQHMVFLEKLTTGGDYTTITTAMQAYVWMYDQFYEDPNRRTQLKETMAESWIKVPLLVRYGYILAMAESALRNADAPTALTLITEAQEALAAANLPLRERVITTAGLIELRGRAGDKENARRLADETLAAFTEQSGNMLKIHRASTLYPLAQAYQSLGAATAAQEAYRKAIEYAVAQPNSRLRALDIAAICCSMAESATEPDDAMIGSMRKAVKGLGNPW